jgi:hypothetical protein
MVRFDAFLMVEKLEKFGSLMTRLDARNGLYGLTKLTF